MLDGLPGSTVITYSDWFDEPAAELAGLQTTAFVIALASWARSHGLADWIPTSIWTRRLDKTSADRAMRAGLTAPAVRDGMPGVRFTAWTLAYVETLGEVRRRASTRARVAQYRERLRRARGAPEPAPLFDPIPPELESVDRPTWRPSSTPSDCGKVVDVTQYVTPQVTQSVTLAAPDQDQDQDQDPNQGQKHPAPSGAGPVGGEANERVRTSLLCALVGRERDADPTFQAPTGPARSALLERAIAVCRRARFMVEPARLQSAIRQVEVARARTVARGP
jgi:hypothetical protein